MIGRTDLLRIGCALDHLHLRNVIRPRIVPQNLSDLPAQAEGTIQVPDVVHESVVKSLVSCFARLRVVGIFELGHPVRSTVHVDSQTTLTTGKISGVLNATSYNSLSPSVRRVYPDITSSGTPSSSLRVKLMRPYHR